MSGRGSEDFIAGREHKRVLLPVRGGWVCGRKCEDFVTGRWPRSRNMKSENTRFHPPPQKSKVRKHKALHIPQEVRQNKNKQNTRCCLLAKRLNCIAFSICKKKDRFDSVTPSKQKKVKPNAPSTAQKRKVQKRKAQLPRKKVRVPSARPLPRQKAT